MRFYLVMAVTIRARTFVTNESVCNGKLVKIQIGTKLISLAFIFLAVLNLSPNIGAGLMGEFSPVDFRAHRGCECHLTPTVKNLHAHLHSLSACSVSQSWSSKVMRQGNGIFDELTRNICRALGRGYNVVIV